LIESRMMEKYEFVFFLRKWFQALTRYMIF
jgi:hypothetical protein